MATTAQNQGIINSWSLIAFAKLHGAKMQVGEFTNSDTGEQFHSCIFGEGDSKVFAAFSSKLGEMTPREIAAKKDTLQVVQLTSGHYCLCAVGSNAWETVDLGL